MTIGQWYRSVQKDLRLAWEFQAMYAEGRPADLDLIRARLLARQTDLQRTRDNVHPKSRPTKTHIDGVA